MGPVSSAPEIADLPVHGAADGYGQSKAWVEIFARGLQAASAPVVTPSEVELGVSYRSSRETLADTVAGLRDVRRISS